MGLFGGSKHILKDVTQVVVGKIKADTFSEARKACKEMFRDFDYDLSVETSKEQDIFNIVFSSWKKIRESDIEYVISRLNTTSHESWELRGVKSVIWKKF